MSLTLDKVCTAFTAWRANKTNKQEKVPHNLWDMVSKLIPNYQISEICKTLHLSSRQLKTYVLQSTDLPITPVTNIESFAEAFLPQASLCELAIKGEQKILTIKLNAQQLQQILPIVISQL